MSENKIKNASKEKCSERTSKYTQGKQITNTRKDEKCENNQKYVEKVRNAIEKYKKTRNVGNI